MKTKLPESFREYFWDVDFDSLTLKEAPIMILKRVLDRGNTSDIFWLKEHYSMDDIKKLLLFTRDLSPKTGTFWADILKLPYSQVVCLQKPYSPIQWGLYS